MGSVTGGETRNNVIALLAEASVNASAATAAAQAAADILAEAMQRIHGGDWRTQLDHEHGFVIVARLLNRDEWKHRPEAS